MTDDYERLDDFMKARRFELGMRTWRVLAESAGISYETLRSVRAGGNPGDATVNGLEKALQWAPGSIDAMLAGGEPTPLKTGPSSAAQQPEDDVALAVLERIERDPRLQRRLRRILAAGSGHAEESSGYGTSDTKGDSGRDVAG